MESYLNFEECLDYEYDNKENQNIPDPENKTEYHDKENQDIPDPKNKPSVKEFNKAKSGKKLKAFLKTILAVREKQEETKEKLALQALSLSSTANTYVHRPARSYSRSGKR